MVKLLIWTLSFWKPWQETYTAWLLTIQGWDPPMLFWLDLNFFTQRDFYEYYEDDYLVQTLIKKLKHYYDSTRR